MEARRGGIVTPDRQDEPPGPNCFVARPRPEARQGGPRSPVGEPPTVRARFRSRVECRTWDGSKTALRGEARPAETAFPDRLDWSRFKGRWTGSPAWPGRNL